MGRDMQRNDKTRSLLNKSQVAQRSQFSIRTIDYKMAAGELPFIKFRGAVRFLPEDVDHWISSHRVGGAKSKIRKGNASP
jgi:predicted DNA-binding transcriptional regulator AlpA